MEIISLKNYFYGGPGLLNAECCEQTIGPNIDLIVFKLHIFDVHVFYLVCYLLLEAAAYDGSPRSVECSFCCFGMNCFSVYCRNIRTCVQNCFRRPKSLELQFSRPVFSKPTYCTVLITKSCSL